MRIERKKSAPIGDSGREAKRVLLMICVGAFCIGAAFLAATVLFSACSAQAFTVVKANGSASISVQASVPEAIAVKFRKLAAGGGSSDSDPAGSFFDAAAIRSSLAKKPGISVLSLEQRSPYSINLELSVRSLDELAASPDLKSAGVIAISRGPDWTECRFRLARGEASALSSLMPGIDPNLLDALSPPALEEDPVTADEYKTMLKTVLGEKAMPAIEAAAIKLSITVPGVVIGSGGGSLSGSTLSAKLPIIDLLVLEKPIELWIRWKN
jgi:hypothetical protein